MCKKIARNSAEVNSNKGEGVSVKILQKRFSFVCLHDKLLLWTHD